MARIPIELDVAVPIRNFRVRNLLDLERGQVIESIWQQGEDLPLAAPGTQLAWSEFEVVDQKLAVRPDAAPIIRRLTDSVRSLIGASSSPVLPMLLCPSAAGYYLRRWLGSFLPRLPAAAAAEIPAHVRFKSMGTVR